MAALPAPPPPPTRVPEDSGDRSCSPGSISDRSAVQSLPVTCFPQMEVSYWAETRRTGAACRQCGAMRWLNRQACVACGAFRSQRCRKCNFCGSDTRLHEFRVVDTFRDRFQHGRQDVAASGTLLAVWPLISSLLRDRMKYLKQNFWTTARALRGSPGLGDGTPAVRGLSVCHSDCKVLDQQNSGPLRRTARRVQSQTGEQRGKRARALTAPLVHQKSHEGIRGRRGAGSVDPRRRRGGPTWLGWSDTNRRGSKVEEKRVLIPPETVANECFWSHWCTAGTLGCHRFLRQKRKKSPQRHV